MFKAVSINAIAFSLSHAVNVFGGASLTAVALQMVNALLFGWVFGLMMIKLNHILPLILFHWLWDFVLFAASIVSPEVATTVQRIGNVILPIEIIVGVLLWLNLRKQQDVILNRIELTSYR